MAKSLGVGRNLELATSVFSCPKPQNQSQVCQPTPSIIVLVANHLPELLSYQRAN